MRTPSSASMLLTCSGLISGGVGASLAAPPDPPTECIQVVPCVDPRGCPDLVVDPRILGHRVRISRIDFSATDCAVVEGEVGAAGQRRLLRFTTNTPNLGIGDLVIGAPEDHPELFEFSTCHGHPHFKEYSDYRLWTAAGYAAWQELRRTNPDACVPDLLAAHPEVAVQMVAGHKQGFCVVDSFPSAMDCPYPGPTNPEYLNCVTFEFNGQTILADQGLSVCWADEYDQSLSGQWIDITGLPRGTYVLEVEVNPERLFEESNYSNNSSAISVKIR